MGPYSGKFPTEVLFTGCFLERQTLPSPVIKEETKAASREVTHPRSQSPRGTSKVTELEMTVSTTVKLRAGSWHCPFPMTVLGLHEPHGFWGADLQDIHARILQTLPECSCVLGVRGTAGNKTDPNLCLPGTYVLVGETENKYICIHIPIYVGCL